MDNWWIFRGTGDPHDEIETKLPDPPDWRTFSGKQRSERIRGEVFSSGS